ncbi:hypothetical protein ACFYYR_17400 [Streptomyces sp. NPDC001922]|uniref:hypothetical protein n=1 Tax=Streptomyces sp. NPDC001922 TaxID=3364624 RepID=UPI00368C4FDC
MSWQQQPQQPHQPQQPGQPPQYQQPAQQPGFGPAPSWQPTPPPTPQPPRRNTNRTVLIAAGAVVVLCAVGGAIALTSGGDDKPNGARKKVRSSPPVSAPAGGGKEGPEAPNAGPTADGPMVKGWQTQTREEHDFSYDVPGKAEKWQVFDDDTALSYNDAKGKPIVVMTGAGNYREGGCSSQPNPDGVGEAGKGQLATVGTTGGGKDGTLQENARNWAGNWGYIAYGGDEHKPKMEVGQAKPWKHNGIEGYTATAKVKVTNRPSKCVPPSAVAVSIAQKFPDGTMHGWVLYADQGIKNALTPAQIQKIMKTVRPAAD